MAIDVIEGAGRHDQSTDGWSRRVLRCAALWVALATVAVVFDVIMEGSGRAADGMPDDLFPQRGSWPEFATLANAAVALVIFGLVLGAIVGSILPSRLDPARLERPLPEPGVQLETPPAVVPYMVRRATAGVPYVVACTCAVLTGLLSITTDIQQDDSPSTLDAIGGFGLGTVGGLLFAIVAGPLVGLAVGMAIDHDVPHIRSTALVAVATLVVAVIPLTILLEAIPEEAPGVVGLCTLISCIVFCVVGAEWLVRWRFRPARRPAGQGADLYTGHGGDGRSTDWEVG